MSEGELLIGRSEEGPVKLPVRSLRRHVTVLGASGSGKTVMGKCLIEEATLAGIPSVLIDPQGDLASLALAGEAEEVQAHGGDPMRMLQFTEKAEVRIFTPASSKGLPLSIDPLELPDAKALSPDERIRAVDLVAKGLTQLLGYESTNEEGKSCAAFLYQLLEALWEKGDLVEDFAGFADLVNDPDSYGLPDGEDFISVKTRQSIAKKLRQFSVGLKKLLFNFGVPVSMEAFLQPAVPGKVPINVIYLNTLTNESDKQFFVAMVAKEIYSWMLQNPSEAVQLVFYIDEVSTYLPPHPRNPPAKEMLTLLFKQGRKYGVSCLMCTQNPADIDYKAMAQANTWALGRMMTKQDLSKVNHMLRSTAPNEVDRIMASLPNLATGHFVLICPDIADQAQQMQVRWLLTRHKTLDEEGLKELMHEAVHDHFESFTQPAKPAPGWLPEEERVEAPPTVLESETCATALEPREREESPAAPPGEPGPRPGTEPTPEDNPEPRGPDGEGGASSISGGTLGARGVMKDAVSHLPGLHRREGGTPGDRKEGAGECPGPLKEYALVPKLRLNQAAVTKLAAKERDSTMFLFKGETLGEITLFYLPVWYIQYDITAKKLGLMKARHTGEVIFHGQTGAMLIVETDALPPFKPKEMAFSNHVDQQPWEYKQFTEFAGYAEEWVRKVEMTPQPGQHLKHSFTRARVKTRFKRLFGHEPTDIRAGFMPLWQMDFKDKKLRGAIRKHYVDGVFGKEVELE